jgi:3-oxoacyl-[acyl-carrier-protein] synthase I
MSSSVSILAYGARTPLGMEAAPSAAALRAKISGMASVPFLRDKLGQPMTAALDSSLDLGVMGSSRLVAFSETALQEMCAPLKESLRDRIKVPLFLGLPETRPGFADRDLELVRHGLGQIEGLPVEIGEIQLYPHGHAAGLVALAAALEKVKQGPIGAAILGGADSYYKPETLEWLDSNRQLAGADSRSSFVPGEGAGFCLLATEAFSSRLKMRSIARLSSAGMATETKLIKTEAICLGEGLAKAVESALVALDKDALINQVICDVNGERYRSEEWGFVCLRLSRYFDDPTAYLSPADSWGDVGAASVPLFMMIACEATRRGYALGRRTLLWASSEGGLRGATVLETAQ